MPRRKFDRSERSERKKKDRLKFAIQQKRWCRYCVKKDLRIDYKDARLLSPFISERGRIVPRRNTGLCAKHQRAVTLAVKRARLLAIVPYTATQVR